MTLYEHKLRKAKSFYLRNRKKLESWRRMENLTHFDGILDVDAIREATRDYLPSGGYKYCQRKFLRFCALFFGVEVNDLKNYMLNSKIKYYVNKKEEQPEGQGPEGGILQEG